MKTPTQQKYCPKKFAMTKNIANFAVAKRWVIKITFVGFLDFRRAGFVLKPKEFSGLND